MKHRSHQAYWLGSIGLFVAVLTSIPESRSQTSPAPLVSWQDIMPAPAKANWGRDYTWNGSGWTGVPRTDFDNVPIAESGEDWWYDLCVLKDGSGNPIGYAAAGYNTMQNWGYDDELGCRTSEPSPTVDPSGIAQFESISRRKGELRTWLARYDLEGNMLWCRSFYGGAFYSVTQDADGSIVAGGEMNFARMSESILFGQPQLLYNPGRATTETDLSLIDCINSGYGPMAVKPLAMKVDLSGNMVWARSYGLSRDMNSDEWSETSRLQALTPVTLPGGQPGFYLLIETYSTSEPNAGLMAVRVSSDGSYFDHHAFVAGDVGVPAGSGDLQLPYSIRTLEHNGSVHGLVSGISSVGGEIRAWLWHMPDLVGNPYQVDADLAIDTDHPLVGASHTMSVQASTDAVLMDVNGDLMAVWPVLSNYVYNSIYAPNAVATLLVHGISVDQPSLAWTVDLGEVRAFDLRAGATRTSDGKVAIVSSKWETGFSISDPFCFEDIEPSVQPCLLTDFAISTPWEWDTQPCVPDVYRYWNTNSYIAKIDPANGTKVWDMQFDAEPDIPNSCFPGDMRNQECMYHVVPAEDGGLVICGNTSHNFDDGYLAKVGNDCQASVEYWYEEILVDGVYTMTSDDLWNSDRNIYGTVVIPDGFTLTIADCTVRFADSEQVLHPTRIIVEAGGRLIVNNATLTSIDECPNSMWDGIQLRGDEFANQGSGTFGLDQGYLSLRSAVISNARIGVNLASVAFIPPSNPKLGQRSGGILLARDTRFNNNRYDVTFSPYENFAGNDPTQILPNRSSFTRCTFETLGPLNVAALYPKDHVVLSMVRGIQFKGCTFSNALVGTQYQFTSHQGTGIHSLNSSFVVKNDCSVLTQVGEPCPLESTTISSFANLHRGVLATTFDLSRTFSITDARFTRVNFGIRMEGVQDAAINRNRFDVAEPFVPGLLGPTYGIYSDQCTGYSIQENNFTTSSPSGEVKKVGLVIKDSGPYYNTFYNNSFERLYTGSIIQGRNANTDANNIPGLEVKCNDYGLTSQNTFDVALTGDNVRVQKTQGLPLDQQDPTTYGNPAGNRFSLAHNGSGNPEEDWHVQLNANVVEYFHHLPTATDRTDPVYSNEPLEILTSDQVVGWPGEPIACPDLLDDGGTKPVKRMAATEQDAEYTEQAEAYDAAKDNGDTYSLLSYVSDPTHSSTQVRNALQIVAPKVSAEVWQAAFERSTPMSAWHMTQALLINSPLQAEALKMVEVYGLPSYYANLVYSAQTGEVNILTLLESGMASHAGQKADALHDLGQMTWLDSLDLPNSVDSLLLFHTDLPSDNSELEQSAVLTATKQYGGLESFAEEASLSSSTPGVFQVIKHYSQREQNLGWDEVDGELLSWLEQLGTQRDVEGSASANAWLHALGNELPDEVIILPEEGAKRSVREEGGHFIDWANEMLLEAFPNPSNGPVYLAYTLPHGCERGTIQITDLSGRELIHQSAYQPIGLLQVPTENWNAGLYVATLHADGQQIKVKISFAP